MLLLDTHIYLWFVNGDTPLSKTLNEEIQTCEDVFVSVATFWELAIKNSLGKLELPSSIPHMMEDCSRLDFTILPINGMHLARLKDLPWHHRDPFDRLIICQAQEEHLTLISADANVKRYDVKTFWK